MPYNPSLGTDERFYRNNLSGILKNRTKEQIECIMHLIENKPVMDEDVKEFFNDLMNRGGVKLMETVKEEKVSERNNFEPQKALTNMGILREDVNKIIQSFSEKGWARDILGENKKSIIKFLTLALVLDYKSDKYLVRSAFKEISRGEFIKGKEFLVKRIIEKPDSYLFDRNFLKNESLLLENGFDEEAMREFKESKEEINFHYTMLTLTVRSEILKDESLKQKYLFIPKKSTKVISKIIIIRWSEENIVDKKILKGDLELMKILGIPYNTYRRKSDALKPLITHILEKPEFLV